MLLLLLLVQELARYFMRVTSKFLSNSMSQTKNDGSAFSTRNRSMIGTKILSLLESNPNGTPFDALLHTDKLGTGDVNNFQAVLPAFRKGPTRSKKTTVPLKNPGARPPVKTPYVPKSSSLTSNQSISSRPRPISAKKSLIPVATKRSTKKKSAGKSPVAQRRSKPYEINSQRRPNTTSGDFASSRPTEAAVGKYRGQLARKSKSTPQKNNKIVPQTQVVLAPRFGPESSEPSIANVMQYQEIKRSSTAPEGQAWRKKCSPTVVSTFPPEKAKWVQKAVYKFGESFWTTSGVMPPSVIDSPEFQDNIGELYDLAVQSRSLETVETQQKSSSDERTLIITSDDNSDQSKSSLGTKLSFSLASSKDPSLYVTEMEQQVSDLILDALKEKLLRDNKNVVKKDASTDTRSDCNVIPEVKLDDIFGKSEDLKDDKSKLIKNCYISDGKILREDEPYKFSPSTFAPLSTSLKKLKPSLNNTYFRRSVGLRGFEAHELRFKYSASRIFVEGRQAQKGDKNARLVREIIALPEGLSIENIKVMRGQKGVVVFEEILKPS